MKEKRALISTLILWLNESVVFGLCLWEGGFWTGITHGRVVSADDYIARADPIITPDVLGVEINFPHFGPLQCVLSLLFACGLYLLTKMLFAMIAERCGLTFERLCSRLGVLVQPLLNKHARQMRQQQHRITQMHKTQ